MALKSYQETILTAYTKVLLLQIAAGFVMLLILWQVSRYVDPSIYGQYVLYLSILTLFTTVLVNWPNAALLRFGREEWNQKKHVGETLGTRFFLYFIGCGLGVCILLLLKPFLIRFLDIQTTFLFLIVGIFVTPLAEIGIYAHQAQGYSLPYGFVPLITRLPLLIGISLLPFLNFKASLTYLISLFLLGSTLSVIISYSIFHKNTWHHIRFSKEMLRKIFCYSWVFPLSGITSVFVNWGDAWIIRYFIDNYNVGIYTWAYQVVSLGNFMFIPFGALLTPIMVDAYLSGKTEILAQHGHRSFRLMVFFGIVGSVLLALVYPLLSLIATADYKKSYNVLIILLSTLPLQLLSYLITPLGNSLEFLISRIALISIGIALIKILGNILLIPSMGITGAAVASFIVFFGSVLIPLHLLKRYVTGLPPPFRFAMGGLVMPVGVFCLLIGGPVIGGILCLLTGTGGLLITRFIGLYTIADALWIERQSIPRIIKKPLVGMAMWLSMQK